VPVPVPVPVPLRPSGRLQSARDMVSSKGCSDHDPCTSSTTPSHCEAQPISADEDGQKIVVNAEAVPSVFVLLFVRCGCLLLPFHRNSLGLSSQCQFLRLHARTLSLPFEFWTPPPPTRPLLERVSCATLDWNILRKGCRGTMITT
jgi:hypothetical protein